MKCTLQLESVPFVRAVAIKRRPLSESLYRALITSRVLPYTLIKGVKETAGALSLNRPLKQCMAF